MTTPDSLPTSTDDGKPLELPARDAAVLSALQGLADPDGWVRARARGQLLDASGLSWSTWRRAVDALVEAGHVEAPEGGNGGRAATRCYRVLTTRSARCRHVAGTFSGTLPAPPLKNPEGLILGDPSPRAIPPEGVPPGTLPARSSGTLMDVADAIRYLADTLATIHASQPSVKPVRAPKAPACPVAAPASPQAALFDGVPAEPAKGPPVDVAALATNIMRAWNPPKGQPPANGTPGIEPSGQHRLSSRAEIEKALASILSKSDEPRTLAHEILAGVKAFAAVKRSPEERTRVPAQVPWLNKSRWTIPIALEAPVKQRLERGELTDAPVHGWGNTLGAPAEDALQVHARLTAAITRERAAAKNGNGAH